MCGGRGCGQPVWGLRGEPGGQQPGGLVRGLGVQQLQASSPRRSRRRSRREVLRQGQEGACQWSSQERQQLQGSRGKVLHQGQEGADGCWASNERQQPRKGHS